MGTGRNGVRVGVAKIPGTDSELQAANKARISRLAGNRLPSNLPIACTEDGFKEFLPLFSAHGDRFTKLLQPNREEVNAQVVSLIKNVPVDKCSPEHTRLVLVEKEIA
jgi:hypothetical protein